MKKQYELDRFNEIIKNKNIKTILFATKNNGFGEEFLDSSLDDDYIKIDFTSIVTYKNIKDVDMLFESYLKGKNIVYKQSKLNIFILLIGTILSIIAFIGLLFHFVTSEEMIIGLITFLVILIIGLSIVNLSINRNKGNEEELEAAENNEEELHQTSRLDFSKIVNNSKQAEVYNLEQVKERYIVLTGMDTYIKYLKLNNKDDDQVLKLIRKFMLKIYFSFQNDDYHKLIFVWQSNIFINPDLSMLVFDKVFRFSKIDTKDKFKQLNNIFSKNSYYVNQCVKKFIIENIEDTSKIDPVLINEMNMVNFTGLDDSVLAYLQFSKIFLPDYIDEIKQYFNEAEEVALDCFTLTQSEFKLYLNDVSLKISESSKLVETTIKFVNDAKDNADVIDYYIEDDIATIIEHLMTVTSYEKLYQYLNLEIMTHLLNGNSKHKNLAAKIFYSLINAPTVEFEKRFKKMLNIIVQTNETKNILVLEILLKVMIGSEKQADLAFMYCNADYYVNNNKGIVQHLLMHINPVVDRYEVLSENKALIQILIS